MQATLHIIDGPEAGKSFNFTGADSFLVGRTKKAHLRFDAKADQRISRNHFLLEIRPPRCIITDLQSKNGTYVNDKLTRQADLNDGDEIRVGRTRMIISIRHFKEAAPTTPTCAVCGKDVTPEISDISQDELENFVYTCQSCRKKAETTLKQTGMFKALELESGLEQSAFNCMICETDLSGHANNDGLAGQLIHSMYLCEKCASHMQKENVEPKSIDDYMLLDVLGKGGMGVVYKAVDRRTWRICALKMILPDLVLNEYAAKLFEREVSVQSKIVHPNLVRVLDRGRSGANPYFVTEYLSGGDIKNLVSWEFQGPVPAKMSTFIAIQILTGLKTLHERGFIHRDLKPSNFLLDRPYTEKSFLVKIADYGLAKSYENAGNSIFDYSSAGFTAGSYVFIPPEQITNYKFVKPPVDVYAVGTSLYFMLCAKYSVDFPNPEEPDAKSRHPVEIILEEPPIPILERNKDIPEGLAKVVDKAVVKNVGKRFQTAAEFRAALVQAARTEGWMKPAG